MRKNVKNTIVGLGMSLLMVACSGEMENKAVTLSDTMQHERNVDMRLAKSRSYGDAKIADFNEEMQAFSNLKLIRSGDIKFQTKDIDETEARIKWIVQKMGGFISFEQQTRNEWTVRTDIEIRMPGTVFEPMLDSICSGAYMVDQKNIKVQDVTKQYVDTEARIQTRKLVEEKYIEHLKSAQDIDDVLRIEAKIGEIREEIESAEKRLRSLKDQVALSTLHVEFYQKDDMPVKEEKNRFEQALNFGWRGFEAFLVGLTSIWPLLLIGFGILFGVRKYRKSRSKE